MVWVLLALIASAAILAWMYRRSDPTKRTKSLFFVIGWLVITAPAAYFKFGMNAPATASSAVVGLAILAAGTRGRLDLASPHLDQEPSVDDGDGEKPTIGDWIFIVGPMVTLAVIILWP